MTLAPTILVLRRKEVEGLLDLASCVDAVEEAFKAGALGLAYGGTRTTVAVDGGAFHTVVGGLRGTSPTFGVKVNGRFAGQGGMRTRGVVMLADARDGTPRALLDSRAITITRTAAAIGVATRHLARADSRRALVIGAGAIGRASVKALKLVLSDLAEVVVLDRHTERAAALVADLREAGVSARPADSLDEARSVDVVVTATRAVEPILDWDDVLPGTFIAAVGADSPEKQELTVALVARSALIVDDLQQCLVAGELHHAVAAAAMTEDAVRATIGEVAAGLRVGRQSREEVVVFDATGTALQDIAAARLVVDRAVVRGIGETVPFDD